jgi:hypothetical protein
LFTNSLLFTYHFSSFVMLLLGFYFSLLVSWCNHVFRWWIVWFPPSQELSADCIILNRCRYALNFSWPVTIAVKFGVRLMWVVSLSLIFGKKSFVVKPLKCMCQEGSCSDTLRYVTSHFLYGIQYHWPAASYMNTGISELKAFVSINVWPVLLFLFDRE